MSESPETTESTDDKKSSSGPLMGVLAFLMALGLGFLIGRVVQDDFDGPPVLDDDTRYDVDLRGDEPVRGPENPLVTVVEFADYQCPYCARARQPLEDAMAKRDDDVRLIYKHFPLPGHRLALPAAKAAWAAHQQGKFWEMHKDLFEANSSVKDIAARAEAMGMDPEVFLRDYASPAAAKAVDDDMLAGAKLGVTGTPVFYVNGHRYVGFRDKGQWTEVLEFEADNAERLIDAGTPKEGVYAKLMQGAVKQRRSRDPNPPKPAPQPGGLDPDVTYRVDVAGRPALGPADALVTVAVFSDFQCPYCGRIAPSLRELAELEKGVRVVSMQLPIPSHPRAHDAAKAALAAQKQGKYWEMHDKLFEVRESLGSADFSAIAEELGLDVTQFEADLQDEAIEEQVRADVEMARDLGVRSTPATFVNGHYVRGAVPIKTLRQAVAAQRPMAQALVDAGTPMAGVYEALMAEAAVAEQ
ncbi:MAG: DsbA family protein [Nannocystales bacterium]